MLVSFGGADDSATQSLPSAASVTHLKGDHLGTIYKHFTKEELNIHLEDKFPMISRNNSTENFYTCHCLAYRLNILR